MERRRGWWAVGLVLGMGCDRGEQPVSAVEEEPSATLSAAPSAAPAPSAVPAPSPGLPPLAVPSAKDTIPGMTKLPVEGHRAAWISAPRGATDARPLLIYAHGAGGNAYATCQDARTLVADDAFVLCPFGTDHPLWGETYESIGAFQDEVEGGIEAIASRYRGYVDVAHPILVGWSIGANLAATLAIQQPARFPRLMLVEGGALLWTAGKARTYREGGGERVVFVCGREKCRRAVARASPILTGAQVEVMTVDVPHAGHSFRTPASIRARELPWLVAGSRRWAALLGDGG